MSNDCASGSIPVAARGRASCAGPTAPGTTPARGSTRRIGRRGDVGVTEGDGGGRSASTSLRGGLPRQRRSAEFRSARCRPRSNTRARRCGRCRGERRAGTEQVGDGRGGGLLRAGFLEERRVARTVAEPRDREQILHGDGESFERSLHTPPAGNGSPTLRQIVRSRAGVRGVTCAATMSQRPRSAATTASAAPARRHGTPRPNEKGDVTVGALLGELDAAAPPPRASGR